MTSLSLPAQGALLRRARRLAVRSPLRSLWTGCLVFIAVAVGVVVELRPVAEVDHVVGRVVFELDHLAPFDPALQQGPRGLRGLAERGHAVARLPQVGGKHLVGRLPPTTAQQGMGTHRRMQVNSDTASAPTTGRKPRQ